MKNKAIFLVVLIAVGIAGVWFVAKDKEQKRTEMAESAMASVAPAFELRDLSGKSWKLSDLRGKVVLVTFWATWCPSCKEENPSIQKFFLSEQENKDLVYLSVLVQDKPEAAVEYMKTNGFTFPVLIDDGSVAQKYGITGVPETFIIDRKGAIKDRVIGPAKWDSPQVKTSLSGILAERS
ncbi:MAG: TlpA family protein disulfide reductase [Nitrospirales bacterium]|nr:TlpA family protein disulfide reductase [Nitrospirales bacterium]